MAWSRIQQKKQDNRKNRGGVGIGGDREKKGGEDLTKFEKEGEGNIGFFIKLEASTSANYVKKPYL